MRNPGKNELDSNPFHFAEINVKGQRMLVYQKEPTQRPSPKKGRISKRGSPSKKYQQLMQGKIKKISVSQGNEDSDGQEITVRD